MNEYHYLNTQQILNCKQYPFTRGQLRYFLTRRNENGLASAVRKIGRRLYLRKDLFEDWIESQLDTEEK